MEPAVQLFVLDIRTRYSAQEFRRRALRYNLMDWLIDRYTYSHCIMSLSEVKR
jgi:hypothetical protein